MPKIMEESDNSYIIMKYNREFHYQKFRYKTENRTGKKQHPNPMMFIKVPNLPDEITKRPRLLKMYIFCVAPYEPFCIHPNKLVGVDCSDGVYHTTDVSKLKQNDTGYIMEIPYLYICRTKKNDVKSSLEKTLKYLPSTVKGKFKLDTTMDNDSIKTDSIRLQILLDIDGREYNQLTSIITHHDSGEKVKLNIVELTKNTFTCEDKGYIWILTEDSNGPDIKPDEYDVSIKTDNWQSEPYILKKNDIQYKRMIKYEVPGCQDRCLQTGDVKGKLILRCCINNLTCERDIVFIQSKLNRKRKALNERTSDIKIPRVEYQRGLIPVAAFQESNSMESTMVPNSTSSNSNKETSSNTSYHLLQNEGGKAFVAAPQQPITSEFEQQQSTFEGIPQTFTSYTLTQQSLSGYAFQQPTSECVPEQLTTECVPQQPTSECVPEQLTTECVPQQPTSERFPQQYSTEFVPQQPTSERVPQQPTSEFVPQQPISEFVSHTMESNYPSQQSGQEMETDGSNLCLSHETCTSENNPPQEHLVSTELDISGQTGHTDRSFGLNDSGYVESIQPMSSLETDSTNKGTKSLLYQPVVEPVTPTVDEGCGNIIEISAQLSNIPRNSFNGINPVEENLSDYSVCDGMKKPDSNPIFDDMKGQDSTPGSSLNLNSLDFNLTSVDIMNNCSELVELTSSDPHGDSAKK